MAGTVGLKMTSVWSTTSLTGLLRNKLLACATGSFGFELLGGSVTPWGSHGNVFGTWKKVQVAICLLFLFK